MSFNNGEMVGNYRILEQLGQGGMATVFKAYHAALDRYVALKVLHPALLEDTNFLTRFQREARVVARLEHPNIVPVHDFAEHEGRPFLVMKFIEGETLKARLQGGRLAPEEIPQIVETVGDALAYAHRQGILHRDIKPSNVMMANDGHIYLADFGLARIAQAGESTLTSDMIVGTPQYISPEQAVGKKDLDEGTDIYSFGVMLYELIVGRVPFSADTPYAVIHDHIYSPLPLPAMVNPSVAPEMERMLLKALAKERCDRFKDVPEMVRAFKEAWEVQSARWLAAKQTVATPDAETAPPVAPIPALPPVVVEPEPEPDPETTPVPAPIVEPISPPETGFAPELPPSPVPELAPKVGKKSRGCLRWVWIPVGGVLLTVIAGLVLILRQNPAATLIPATGTTRIVQIATITSPPTRVYATATPLYPVGVLFQSNLDTNQPPSDWRLEPGWQVKDGMLCGTGHAFAGSTQENWKDYAASFRLKVDKGFIHLNLHQSSAGGLKRYFISFVPSQGLGLNKQVDQVFSENLAGLDYGLETGKWYQIQLVAQGQRILVLVDGVILLDYIDPQALAAGGISFETLDNSTACVDDIRVADLTGKEKFDLLNAQSFTDQVALRGWQMMDGAGKPNSAWSVQSGALCGSGHNWAVFREISLADFNASLRLSIKAGSLHLNFRLHDQPFWRYHIWMGTNSNTVNLARNYVDKDKPLITARAVILPAKWYDVRVSLIAGRIQLWINDKRVIDETDKDPLGSGFIGFESLDDAHNICIDDLLITKPSLAKTP